MSYDELYQWRITNIDKQINSQNKWRIFIKNNNINNIPKNPNKVYKGRGWVSWGTFLGTKYIGANERKYMYVTLEKFKEWLINNNIKNSREFNNYENKPKSIPSHPERTYCKWLGWKDVLLTCKDMRKDYWDYDTCKKFLFDNYGKLTYKTFRLFSRNNTLPRGIPKKPEKVFENFTASDFFSSYSKLPKRYYYTFEESLKLVHTLNIKTNYEWKKYVKLGIMDKRIPSSPYSTYKEEWTTWYHWLGK
jgi:hypothetical protein